jgi:hypothetical protein
MPNTNNKLNSKYGFDLGSLSNVEISGVTSGNDQILVIKKDVGTGKFYLEPQDYDTGVSADSITLNSAGSSYFKKIVFNSTSTGSAFSTIKELTFSTNTSNKIYLTVKLDLIGQGNDGGIFNYYHFTTGYNLVGNIVGNQKQYRHVPGHFSYIFTRTGGSETVTCIGPEAQFQQLSAIPQNNTLILQPKFSTLTNALDTTKYPRINLSQNTGSDEFYLTIQAKGVQSTTETITWFGTMEIFASIV